MYVVNSAVVLAFAQGVALIGILFWPRGISSSQLTEAMANSTFVLRYDGVDRVPLLLPDISSCICILHKEYFNTWWISRIHAHLK